MFTKNAFNGKADPVADSIKAIAEADYALKMEALKGDQVKLDKNKNNKLDADDFKILRGKKKVNEADEKPRSAGSVFDKDVAKSFEKKKPGESTGHEAKKTSTGTQYTKKAPAETNESFSSFKDKLKSGAKKVLAKVGGGSDEDQRKRLQKNMGIPQTGKPAMAKQNEEFDLEAVDPALVEEFMQTEEFEQLDELSKKTLSSYVKKSSDDLGYHAARVAGGVKDVARHGGKNTPIGKELQKDVEKSVHIRDKRSSGIDKAATKLAKEEVEEISELKKSTLASYVKKAAKDSVVQGFAIGDAIKSKNWSAGAKAGDKSKARVKGVERAVDRLAKEEVKDEYTRKVEKYLKKKYSPVKSGPKSNGGDKQKDEKPVREEVEEINELKKSTLTSYVDKAKQDNKDYADSRRSGDKEEAKWGKERLVKRNLGMFSAKKRLAKEDIESVDEGQKWPDTSTSLAKRSAVATSLKGAPSKAGRTSGMTVATRVEPTITSTKVKKLGADRPVPSFLKKEEVEQIEELSKGTLSSYANKSATDAVDNLSKAHDFKSISDRIKARPAGKVGDNLMDRASKLEKKHQDKANKRTAGFIKATTRLKKEEVETLDELNKDTLQSYQDKAMKTAPSKNGNWVSRINGIARSAEKLKKKD
jgi:hypothetical protein